MVTEQQYREILQRWMEILNARDWDAFDKLVDGALTPDYVGHLPGGPVRGAAGMKQAFRSIVGSIPGYRATIEDVVAAGDKGAARMTTHRTDPASGKTQCLPVLLFSRMKGDKFAEDWELIGAWQDET